MPAGSGGPAQVVLPASIAWRHSLDGRSKGAALLRDALA